MLILKLSVRNGPSVSFRTNIPCSLPFIITFRIGHKTRFRSFKNNELLKPVLRIHLILMRIRILNPHWKKMDPDPVYFFWWTIQKWGNFYNLFFQKFRVEFSSKDFFAVFGWYFTPWIWIQEAKILRSPRIRIPDPKHCSWTMILSSFSTSKSTFFCTTEYWGQKSSRIQRYFFVQIQLVFITSIQKPKFRSREVLQKM